MFKIDESCKDGFHSAYPQKIHFRHRKMPPASSDPMLIKALFQAQLVPWVHKKIQSTRQLNVLTMCK